MGTLSFVDIDPSVTVLLPSLVPSVLFVKIVEPTKVPKAACATFVKAILAQHGPAERRERFESGSVPYRRYRVIMTTQNGRGGGGGIVKPRQSICVDPPADKYSTALFRTGSRFLGPFVRPCSSAAILPELVVAISAAAAPIVLARLTPLS
jgi:hypothetical protein